MAEVPKLPDQETFTREELSREWQCDPYKIDAYIRLGQLKETLPPAAMRGLRRWMFYRCEDDEPLLNAVQSETDANDSCEWLLDLIEDGELLGKYIGKVAQEKIIPCPERLYIPTDNNAIIKRYNPHLLKGRKHPPDLVRYFYDLYGNALIPLEDTEDGYRICFAFIEKHHMDSLIICNEEVRRFIGRGKKTRSTVIGPKYKKIQQEHEDSEVATPKTVSKLSDKRPDVPDRLIDIKEVCKRVGFAKPTIYKKVREGVFPPLVKKGISTFWRESTINAYIAGRWKPSDDEDSKKESDE